MSPDENYFLSGGNDKKLLVWSVKNQVPIMKQFHEGAVRAIDWSYQ